MARVLDGGGEGVGEGEHLPLDGEAGVERVEVGRCGVLAQHEGRPVLDDELLVVDGAHRVRELPRWPDVRGRGLDGEQ